VQHVSQVNAVMTVDDDRQAIGAGSHVQAVRLQSIRPVNNSKHAAASQVSLLSAIRCMHVRINNQVTFSQ
jgi:hypothetical protein